MNLKFRKSAYLPHQWEFLKAKQKIKGLIAGFGSGKTHVFLRETFKHHILNKDFKTGRSNGWIIYPTYPLADELFAEPFLDFLDSKGIKYKYNIAKRVLKTKYGTIRIYQLQKPQRMVGAGLTFIGFDEFDIESRKNCNIAYKKGLGRLRGSDHPCLYMVTTPEGYQEAYRIFITEKNKEKFIVHARTYDNPYLPEGYIKTLEAEYDSKLSKGYLDGLFTNLMQGSIYYSFDRDEHVAKQNIPFDPMLPLCLCLDFNVSPMCWELVQYHDKEDIRVLGEIVLKNTNTWSMCAAVKKRFPKGKNIDLVVYGDASGKHQDTRGNETDYTIIDQELGEYFRSIIYKVPTGNPPIRTRHAEVNARLSHDAVSIDKSCKYLITDLEQVAYKSDGSGEPDTSNKDLTHPSDGFGYFINVECPIQTRRKPGVIKNR